MSFRQGWLYFTTTGSFSAAIVGSKLGLTPGYSSMYSEREYKRAEDPRKMKHRIMIIERTRSPYPIVNEMMQRVDERNIQRFTDRYDPKSERGGWEW